MDKDEMEMGNTSYTLKGSSETLLPIQLFEFKTHLLEAVEELRMGRLAKIQYEEQISKILMEKQELQWIYESLSNQEEILEKRHQDALAVLKKQLQTKMCTMEEEKGRFQLAAETKEREIIGLREDMKALQISKYSLQKKAHEMEQKLQLHIIGKEDHMKQLSECEKCFGNVTQQFGMIKEVHEKLEQNVQAAIQNNKKLNTEIKHKHDEIHHLKEELKKLSSDFMNYRVTYQQRAGEEKISLFEKEQQLKELKERLQTETELNKRLMEVNFTMKEEKQEDTRTLNNMLTLVQRHNQTIVTMENQMSEIKEDYKTLQRDNELQRTKATENEEKFLALQSEHEKALRMWKKQEESLNVECDTIKKELESLKEVHKHLQECNSESVNSNPETMIQVDEHQHANNMDTKECGPEHSTSGNRIQNGPVDIPTSSNLECSSAVSLPVTSNEMQKRNERTLEYICQDGNSLPNVYNTIDKAHLIEEQKEECSLTENKANFATVEQNVQERCDGKCTEEVAADRAYLNDVDEYDERAAECSTPMQTQVIVESVKMLLDNNKPLTVCREDASQQTDSSNRKSGDGTSEVVYIVNDKTNTTENEKGVLVNEICTQESELFPETTEQLIYQQRADRDISPAGNSTSCTFGDGSSYHSPVLNWGTSELSTVSCLNDQNKLSKTDPTEPTKESPAGVCADLPLCKHTRRDDQKSVVFEDAKKDYEDMGINASFKNTGIEEMESKSLGHELNSSTTTLFIHPSSSCQRPMNSASLQSALDPKHDNQNSQSSQHTENSDASKVNLLVDFGESCPPESGEDAKTGKSSTSDINLKRELCADKHIVTLCQMIEQTSDPVYLDKENACIQEEANMAVSGTSQEDRTKPSCTKPVSSPEEKPKTQNEGAINVYSNFAKFVCLPRANPWSSPSVNLSFSKQNNSTFPKVSSQSICATAEYGSSIKRRVFDTLSTNVYPVPRKDHSAEWNAIEQTFHNSSFPTEHSDVMERRNRCPVITTSNSSPDLNNQHGKPQPELPCRKDDNCSVSSIQCQISAIEKFLMCHRLNGPQKRKLEDRVEAEELKDNI